MGNYKKKIFILHEGGVFHNIEVSPDLADVEIVTVDLDTEGLDAYDLSQLNGQTVYVKRGKADGIAKPSGWKIFHENDV